MKILITGANGFVGSHLCEKLIKEGHFVFALVRSPSKFKILPSENMKVIKGDLDQEILEWMNEIPHDLDSVIHTAGIVHNFNTDEFFRINSQGTLHLVNNLKLKFKQLHFILISSLAAGGPSLSHNKRQENDLDLPVSLYGKSKKQAEVFLKDHAPKDYRLSVIRPPMVIGPRDSAVLDIFKMVKSRFILLPGINSLSKNYSFVCVFDLVQTISLVLNSKKEESFYSAYPEHATFKVIIETIKTVMNKNFVIYLPMPIFIIRFFSMFLAFINKYIPLNIRLTPDKVFELEALNWTCDSTKSETVLSQVYNYDLDQTIKITFEDYKNAEWI